MNASGVRFRAGGGPLDGGDGASPERGARDGHHPRLRVDAPRSRAAAVRLAVIAAIVAALAAGLVAGTLHGPEAPPTAPAEEAAPVAMR